MSAMGEEVGTETCVLDIQHPCRVVSLMPMGKVVRKRSRPAVSEAEGNEKVRVDFPSRNLLFTFQKVIQWSYGLGKSLEGE